jgi:hypothetical protein
LTISSTVKRGEGLLASTDKRTLLSKFWQRNKLLFLFGGVFVLVPSVIQHVYYTVKGERTYRHLCAKIIRLYKEEAGASEPEVKKALSQKYQQYRRELELRMRSVATKEGNRIKAITEAIEFHLERAYRDQDAATAEEAKKCVEEVITSLNKLMLEPFHRKIRSQHPEKRNETITLTMQKIWFVPTGKAQTTYLEETLLAQPASISQQKPPPAQDNKKQATEKYELYFKAYQGVHKASKEKVKELDLMKEAYNQLSELEQESEVGKKMVEQMEERGKQLEPLEQRMKNYAAKMKEAAEEAKAQA